MAAPVPVGRPTVGLQPAPVGQAFGLERLGAAMGRVGAEVAGPEIQVQEQLQTRDVAHQGELAGAQYGGNTALADLQLPTGSTVAEEAFRKSAVLAAKAQIGIDARANIFKLMDDHPADPQGFQAAAQAGMKGYASKLPPDLQAEALDTYGWWADRGFAQVHEQWKQDQVDHSRATIMKEMDGLTAHAGNTARAGDWAGSLALFDHLGKLYHDGGPLADGGSGAFTATQIEQHREAAHDLIAYQYVRGLVDHTANKQGLLAGLERGSVGDPIADQALSSLKPETRDRLIAATRQEMAQDRADARARAAYQEQDVAINRQLFMEGRATDQLRELADGVKIDNPVTQSEFMSHYPGKYAPAGMKAWASYSRQAAAASVQGEFRTAPADVLDAHVAASAPTPGEPGYAEKSRYYDALVDGRSAVLAKREQYPVEATLKSSPQVAEAWTAASQDPRLLPQAVQASIAEQHRLGIKTIQPLPQGAVTSAVAGWQSGQTANERLAAIKPVTADLGQKRPDGTYDDTLGAKALAQLEKAGLDKGTNYALEAARAGDTPRAHEIVGWLAVDPKNLPDPGEEKAKEVKAAVAQLYTVPNAATAESHAYDLTGQPGAAEAAARGQALLLRGAMIYAKRGEQPAAAAAHALRTLYGDKPVAGNADLGVVPLPAGVTDAKGFENALAITRANVDLSHLGPTREGVKAALPPGTPAGTIEGVFAQKTREFDTLVADIRNGGGRWLAAPGGYQLVTPSGQAVPEPRREPTKDELMAAVEHVTGRPVLRNADGSYATMEQITVTEPEINGGKPTNIPTIWDGKRVDEGEAIRRAADAIKKGQTVGSFVDFRPYDTIEQAVDVAKKSSAGIEPAAYAWWDAQHPTKPRVWTAEEIQHHAMTGGARTDPAVTTDDLGRPIPDAGPARGKRAGDVPVSNPVADLMLHPARPDTGEMGGSR